MNQPVSRVEPLVLLVELRDDDFSIMFDELELDPSGDVHHVEAYEQIVEYLMQWDCGDETEEDAIAYYGLFEREVVMRTSDLIDIDFQGVPHWLGLDVALRNVCLYRTPRIAA